MAAARGRHNVFSLLEAVKLLLAETDSDDSASEGNSNDGGSESDFVPDRPVSETEDSVATVRESSDEGQPDDDISEVGWQIQTALLLSFVVYILQTAEIFG